MKRISSIILCAGLAALALSSCTREQLVPRPEGTVTSTATREGDGTKTNISTSGTLLTWAEGDMIAALGLRYGSDEAIDFAVKVHQTLALAAYNASVEMATERGAFPLYDAAREENNPMIDRIRKADPQLYERMVKSGRRNIAMLTIAPTGTTSLMSQTTSGIEPVFRPVYKRRRKINPSDHNVKVAFIDETGEKFEEFYVFHHKYDRLARFYALFAVGHKS